MNMNENIESLRKTFSNADGDSVLGDEFAKLIKHPELTWNDLIDLLRFKIVIGEYASFKLHDFLGVPISKDGPIREQEEWKRILRDKAINLSDYIQRRIKQ